MAAEIAKRSVDADVVALVQKYSDDEARDEQGQWTSGGAASSGGSHSVTDSRGQTHTRNSKSRSYTHAVVVHLKEKPPRDNFLGRKAETRVEWAGSHQLAERNASVWRAPQWDHLHSGVEVLPVTRIAKDGPIDEPRDEQGKWTDGGGSHVEGKVRIRSGGFAAGEELALKDYGHLAHARINSSMRRGGDTSKYGTKIAAINSALDKSRLEQNTTLYRGVGGHTGDHLARNGVAEKLVGTDLPANSFQSTSTNVGQARRFTDITSPVLLKINAPGGTPAVDMRYYGPGVENEMLLKPGAYHVDSVTHGYKDNKNGVILNVTYHPASVAKALADVADTQIDDDGCSRFMIGDDEARDMFGGFAKYSDDEPRDDHGRWTSGGGFGMAGKRLKSEWIKSRAPMTIQDNMRAAVGNQRTLGAAGSEIAQKHGAEFIDPGVKANQSRIEEKAKTRGANGITDYTRASFVIDTPEKADAIMRDLHTHFPDGVIDEGWQLTPVNYLSRTAMVRYADGSVGEIQVTSKQMSAALSPAGGNGHQMYYFSRSLPQDSALKQVWEARQTALYTKAINSSGQDWKAVAGRAIKTVAKALLYASSVMVRPSMPTSDESTLIQALLTKAQASPAIQRAGTT